MRWTKNDEQAAAVRRLKQMYARDPPPKITPPSRPLRYTLWIGQGLLALCVIWYVQALFRPYGLDVYILCGLFALVAPLWAARKPR